MVVWFSWTSYWVVYVTLIYWFIFNFCPLRQPTCHGLLQLNCLFIQYGPAHPFSVDSAESAYCHIDWGTKNTDNHHTLLWLWLTLQFCPLIRQPTYHGLLKLNCLIFQFPHSLSLVSAGAGLSISTFLPFALPQISAHLQGQLRTPLGEKLCLLFSSKTYLENTQHGDENC